MIAQIVQIQENDILLISPLVLHHIQLHMIDVTRSRSRYRNREFNPN